jgi:hypothetical protein
VTGVFPGVYQYSVSNRATATPSTASFNIEGMWKGVLLHLCLPDFLNGQLIYSC